jgi:hypothetical protein
MANPLPDPVIWDRLSDVELGQRILFFLTPKNDFIASIEIAKHIYGNGAKVTMVNSTLNNLFAQGIITKIKDEKRKTFLWKVIKNDL